jgi:DNA repair protein RadD
VIEGTINQTRTNEMKTELRDYQAELIADIYHKLHNYKSTIAVMATGAGKTVVAARVMSDWLVAKKKKDEYLKRCFFIVHAIQLIPQTIEKLIADGVPERVIGVLGGGNMRKLERPIQIATIQTLRSSPELIELYEPELVIWDECHTTAFQSNSDTIFNIPGTIHLGLTATPLRMKKAEKMGTKFASASIGPSMSDLIDWGNLVPFKFGVVEPPDLSGVRISASTGDYMEEELSVVMSHEDTIKTGIQGLIDCWQDITGKKPTLAFCVSVHHADETARLMAEHGIKAKVVTGNTKLKARLAIKQKLIDCKIDAIVSVNAISTGFDCPAAEIVLDMRPTVSLCLHIQKLGRIARPFPGKSFGAVIDCAGNVYGSPKGIKPVRKALGNPAHVTYTEESALWGIDAPQNRKSCPACKAKPYTILWDLRTKKPVVQGDPYPYKVWGNCSVCKCVLGPKTVNDPMIAPGEKQDGVGLEGTFVWGGKVAPSPTQVEENNLAQDYRLMARTVYLSRSNPGTLYHAFKKKYPDTGGKPPRGSKRGAFLGNSPNKDELITFITWAKSFIQSDEKLEWTVKGETGLSLYQLENEIRSA